MKTHALIAIMAAGFIAPGWSAPPPHRALAYEEIEVGGELLARLERNFGRLHAKRYTEPVLFTETADPKWPGDYEGRTGLALVLTARALGIETPGIDSLMAAFERHYNELGYFGEIHLPAVVDEQQLSSHGWTLRALCEYYNWRKKPETKAQIARIVENLVLPTQGLHKDYPLDPGERAGKGAASGATVAQVGKWRLSSDVGCDFIFFDGVVQAYAVTRDERMVPVIEELVDLFGRMDILGIKAQTHATLSGTRAMIRWYELCGKPEVLARAQQVFDTYLREGCTENFENYNWFGRPEWTEPCAIIDSFLAACQLWQHTGRPAYLEAAHMIYFNGIAATQRSNGGFGLNHCSGAAHPHLCTVTPEAYWCCSMRGSEGLATAATHSAFVDDEGISLTTYAHNMIEVPLKGGRLKLVQTSDYPLGGGTSIKVEMAPAQPVAIRLFSPSFIKARAISVNGAGEESPAADGFRVVKRVWKAGDLLEFDFALVPERVPTRNPHTISGYELIRRGPLLLAAPTVEQAPDKKHVPPAMDPRGELRDQDAPGASLGETRLIPVYHLMDPRYDQTAGSWRQLLFPAAKSAESK